MLLIYFSWQRILGVESKTSAQESVKNLFKQLFTSFDLAKQVIFL
jgi:hypothetical protein